ncbi:MAG: hypothetical protein ABSE59_03030 [Opitutaceae bacterium]
MTTALGLFLLLPPASHCAAEDLRDVSNPPATVHLTRDTSMWLFFSANLDSQTATPGDVVPFVLAGDVKAGERIAVKSGAPATARVILVKKAAVPGRSGTIVIRLDYLQVGQTRVKITGTAGDVQYSNPFLLKWPFGLFRRGEEVEIRQGTGLKAFVAEDCDLPASQ